MEENTLQPGAEENKKPQSQKKKKLKKKDTLATQINIGTKSIKKPLRKVKKSTSSKDEGTNKKKVETNETKTLKKDTGKKKIELKDKVSLEMKKEDLFKELKYSSNNIEELINKFQELSISEDWLKNHKSLQNINQLFNKKFQLDVEEKKKQFLSEGGNEIDFFFKPEYKNIFDQITFEYRKKRRDHFKDQEAAQKVNLEKRKTIIDEIKSLIDQNQIDSKTYKEFRLLQESWYNTGQVPRNESQNLWDTFKHHVERFYAFLHLDREFREMDFNYNYQEKIKIIERAEALKDYSDSMKASRDLNILHNQWKNDLGPVAKEHRENLWTRFQNASKVIQERRHEYQKDVSGTMKVNLNKKEELLLEMLNILKDIPDNHNAWQNALKKFNTLRENFKSIGYVPAKESKASWKSFREVGTEFMKLKNIFYKQQKKAFNSNIDSKRNLINQSKEVLGSEDYESFVQKMKDFQKDWKTIGFVPRKLDNKLWKEFSQVQKEYFDRLKSGFTRVSKEQEELLKKKKSHLDEIKNQIFTAEIDTVKKEYFAHWDRWNNIGRLDPKNETEMNQSFTNSLIKQIKKTKLEKKDLNCIIKDINFNVLKNDPQQLEKEFQAIKSLLSSLKGELTQLENNLDFFSNSSVENPIFKNVEKQINSCQKKIDNAKEEYIIIKPIKNAQIKSAIASEEESNDLLDQDISDRED